MTTNKKPFDKDIMYLQAYMNIYDVVDPKVLEATRRLTPLSSLFPKYSDRNKVKKLTIKQKIIKFIKKIRMKIAYFIAGDIMEEDYYEY